MARFEKVTKYKNEDIAMPVRKTVKAAGYDMVAAEDTLVPPYSALMEELKGEVTDDVYTLDDLAAITKKFKVKPTLVPTGMKCKLDPGTYLELSVRSSCPLKYWLIMANSVGIIDGDYYNNSDNEGHIYFQMINLSPVPIIIKKGEAIGQGIIKPYLKVEGDNATGLREGGFGSTDSINTDVLMPAT